MLAPFVLLPTLEPAHQALHCYSPSRVRTLEPGSRPCPLTPPLRCHQSRLRCGRLRLQLPLGPGCCGQEGHGCRRRLDPWGDHALACTRTGLLARRTKLVERAWLAVCRVAVGAEGHGTGILWVHPGRHTQFVDPCAKFLTKVQCPSEGHMASAPADASAFPIRGSLCNKVFPHILQPHSPCQPVWFGCVYNRY